MTGFAPGGLLLTSRLHSVTYITPQARWDVGHASPSAHPVPPPPRRPRGHYIINAIRKEELPPPPPSPPFNFLLFISSCLSLSLSIFFHPPNGVWYTPSVLFPDGEEEKEEDKLYLIPHPLIAVYRGAIDTTLTPVRAESTLLIAIFGAAPDRMHFFFQTPLIYFFRLQGVRQVFLIRALEWRKSETYRPANFYTHRTE